jgi:DNA-binding MarR family transcriptional regulator
VQDEVDAIVAAWRRERPDLDVEPLHVLSRVARLAAVLDDRRAAAFVEHGLQGHEFDVLSALRRSGAPFELTAGELAALTHVTSGTMTSRLDRLERAGYIDRSIAPGNRASIKVTLTDAGEALHTASADDMIALRRDLMASALAPQDLATLNSLLQQVLTGIENRDPPH